MTILYLIRHSEQLRENGIINSNDNNQLINEKIILSVDGEVKAKRLSELEELQNIDIVYSSSYVRAKQTAKYIAHKNNLDINIDSRFNERKLGDLKNLEELSKTKKYSFTEEQLLDSDFKNIDGENMKEVNYRMNEAINELLKKHENKNIAVISHGAAMKFYLMSFCTLNKDRKLEYNDKIIHFASPSVVKLVFNNTNLISINNIEFD